MNAINLHRHFRPDTDTCSWFSDRREFADWRLGIAAALLAWGAVVALLWWLA